MGGPAWVMRKCRRIGRTGDFAMLSEALREAGLPD
jgi:hypothetical protein